VPSTCRRRGLGARRRRVAESGRGCDPRSVMPPSDAVAQRAKRLPLREAGPSAYSDARRPESCDQRGARLLGAYLRPEHPLTAPCILCTRNASAEQLVATRWSVQDVRPNRGGRHGHGAPGPLHR
jgi:hypothetical protein